MKSALCVIALFCLFNLNSYAQVVNSPPAGGYRQVLEEVVVKEEEYFPQELDSYARYMPSRGAKAQSGKVGIIDSAAEYSYEIKVGERTFLKAK